MSNSSGQPWPKTGSWPHQCECCKDTGILAGDDSEFKFCLCAAGNRRATDTDQMEALREANHTRLKLLGR